MSDHFPLLGSPLDVGPMHLANRIVLLPHGLFFAEPGELRPTDRHVDYYAARARGGAGLVCVESSVVSRDGRQGAPLVLSSDPGAVPGYTRIADAVHEHGARISGQLTHYGNQASQLVTREPLIGPSRLPDAAMQEAAKPADRADMDRIRDDFAAGAATFRAAGFDAVEIKVAHDGLLRQFVSPLCNDRQDEYGGSVENRMRYPLEVAAAVRQAIGPDIALTVRLVLDECLPGGYGLEDGIAFARAFEASGLVDAIVSDVGIWASVHMVTAPMAIPEGYAEKSFADTTAAIDLPVIAFGRIRTPEHGERLIAEGKADAIGMARELIADPDFARKALGGTPEQIRPCTACNQLCVGNAMKLLPVSCTVNPLVGFGEQRDPVSGARRRVVIAGGGPAGMEAARCAALDGHDVVLLEAREQLGGQLALASTTGGRGGWGPYLEWLANEVARVGVDVQLGSPADAETIAGLNPDLVVLAVGATAPPPDLPGALTLDEFLRGDSQGSRVVLCDQGAAGPALWTAALEAHQRGAEAVTIVTPKPVVGGDLDGATFLALYGALNQAGVRFLTDHVMTTATDGGVDVVNVYSGQSGHVPADVVVVSAAPVPAGADIEAELGGERPLMRIGDAVVPRDASSAVREGQTVADALAERPGAPEALRRAAALCARR